MKKLTLLLILAAIFTFSMFSCQKIPMGIQSLGNDNTSDIAKKPNDKGKPENPGNSGKKDNGCITLKDHSLKYPPGHFLDGQPLKIGYDDYGYNYQAHKFNGYYINAYLGAAGFPPYTGDASTFAQDNPGVEMLAAWPFRDIKLGMKWNDAWLSDSDCDGDDLLDRHPGSDSYFGSGAQLTNHMTWEDELGSHESYRKIVALDEPVPPGEALWNSFVIVKEENSGEGTADVPPAAPRVGIWDGDATEPPIIY